MCRMCWLKKMYFHFSFIYSFRCVFASLNFFVPRRYICVVEIIFQRRHHNDHQHRRPLWSSASRSMASWRQQRQHRRHTLYSTWFINKNHVDITSNGLYRVRGIRERHVLWQRRANVEQQLSWLVWSLPHCPVLLYVVCTLQLHRLPRKNFWFRFVRPNIPFVNWAYRIYEMEWNGEHNALCVSTPLIHSRLTYCDNEMLL